MTKGAHLFLVHIFRSCDFLSFFRQKHFDKWKQTPVPYSAFSNASIFLERMSESCKECPTEHSAIPEPYNLSIGEFHGEQKRRWTGSEAFNCEKFCRVCLRVYFISFYQVQSVKKTSKQIDWW